MVQVMVKLRMVTMVIMIMAMSGTHNNHENGWKQLLWFLKTQFGVKRCGDTAIASRGQKYDSVLIMKMEATKTSTNGNAVKTLHIRSQEREATPKCSMANQLVSCQLSCSKQPKQMTTMIAATMTLIKNTVTMKTATTNTTTMKTQEREASSWMVNSWFTLDISCLNDFNWSLNNHHNLA